MVTTSGDAPTGRDLRSFYCLIVEAVTRQGSKFVLDGTTLKYKGGWSKEGYQQVNLPSGTVFQCSEQQLSLIHI